MSRKCTICIHKKRKAIDELLASGRANRRIAAQFAVSENALRRHGKNCIRGQLAKAGTERAAQGQAQGRTLLERLSSLETEARLILDAAKSDGDKLTSLRALAELRKTLETTAKFSPVRLALPAVNDAGGTARAMAAVCEAAALGKITTSEGAGLGALIELNRKALETSELEQRISKLENREGE